MLDLKQEELRKWMVANFGATGEDILLMAMGMAEEVGELNHHVLKGWQGIRGGVGGFNKKEIADAVADTMIYGIQVMSILQMDAEKEVGLVIKKVLQRDWINNPEGNGNGKLAQDEDNFIKHPSGMKKPLLDLYKLARAFDKNFPVGTECYVYDKEENIATLTRVRAPAIVFGGHTPAAFFEGFRDSIPICFVEAIDDVVGPPTDLEEMADEFNQKYQVGCQCYVQTDPPDGDFTLTRLRSEAKVVNGNIAVAIFEDIGEFNIRYVKPLKSDRE